MDGSLVIMEGIIFRDFCYPNGWQPCHYGRQSIDEIFSNPMNGSLVIMEGSLSLRFMLLPRIEALSLWKVVCCSQFCYSNGWQAFHYGMQSIVKIFVIPFDGSLVIMEGSLLSIFLLLQWMVSSSLWKVVCCRDFCYSNGCQPIHYGRQSVVVIFVTPMDGSHVRQSVVHIFVTPMDGSLVIMEGCLLSRFLLL